MGKVGARMGESFQFGLRGTHRRQNANNAPKPYSPADLLRTRCQSSKNAKTLLRSKPFQSLALPSGRYWMGLAPLGRLRLLSGAPARTSDLLLERTLPDTPIPGKFPCLLPFLPDPARKTVSRARL